VFIFEMGGGAVGPRALVRQRGVFEQESGRASIYY
jgi:hypothetical protein